MSRGGASRAKPASASRATAAAPAARRPWPATRPSRNDYESVEEWWDHLRAVAATGGPRLYLSARGECIVHCPMGDACQITLCGSLLADGRDFYDRPLVFEELELVARASLNAALRRSAPLMVRMCPECREALDPPAPGDRWRSDADLGPRDNLKNDKAGARALERVVEIAANGSGARWAQVRGHELRLDRDPTLEPGRAQLVGWPTPEGGTLFSARYGSFPEELAV